MNAREIFDLREHVQPFAVVDLELVVMNLECFAVAFALPGMLLVREHLVSCVFLLASVVHLTCICFAFLPTKNLLKPQNVCLRLFYHRH